EPTTELEAATELDAATEGEAAAELDAPGGQAELDAAAQLDAADLQADLQPAETEDGPAQRRRRRLARVELDDEFRDGVDAHGLLGGGGLGGGDLDAVGADDVHRRGDRGHPGQDAVDDGPQGQLATTLDLGRVGHLLAQNVVLAFLVGILEGPVV